MGIEVEAGGPPENGADADTVIAAAALKWLDWFGFQAEDVVSGSDDQDEEEEDEDNEEDRDDVAVGEGTSVADELSPWFT